MIYLNLHSLITRKSTQKNKKAKTDIYIWDVSNYNVFSAS